MAMRAMCSRCLNMLMRETALTVRPILIKEGRRSSEAHLGRIAKERDRNQEDKLT